MKTNSLNLRQYAVMTGIALSGVGAIGTSTPASALTFTFNPAATTSQQAIDGFKAAGDLWSAKLNNNVNISIDIDFAKLGTNILAQAGSQRNFYNYNNVYTALSNGKTSTDDNAAVASLSNNSFNVFLNRTSNNPNGSGSATPYLDANGDANNTTINMSNANAKALGLIAGAPAPIMTNILTATANGIIVGPNITTVAGTTTLLNQIVPQQSAITTGLTAGADASIAFSTDYTYSFDFNRNGNIAAGTFDFVGLAAHEIGHVLGFTSGVDILDGNSPPSGGPYPDSAFEYVNTLDLFRYSDDSKNAGAIDWTADNRAKYFSLDRGATNIALLSNGVTFGDGRQASHWKDNLGIGIMDPTAGAGEKLAISENDLRAFDVIGWNRAGINATAVPEPADFIGTFIFAAFTADLVLKRRKKLFESKDKETSEVG
jgi:hypothetical protein